MISIKRVYELTDKTDGKRLMHVMHTPEISR
jgi:uncharacterized protein YeaO (DUF488 family)